MYWGDSWGSDWGTQTDVAELTMPELEPSRVLSQMGTEPDDRVFRDFVRLILGEVGYQMDVLDDVIASFALADANGHQLDSIGSLMGLQRSGFSDDDYRHWLSIQALILQGKREDTWTGTVDSILQIIRLFIGPTPGPIVYKWTSPYDFSLVIPTSLSGPEYQILLRQFIRTALYAGVRGTVTIVPEGFNLWDSDPLVVAAGGVWANDGAQNPGIVPAIFSYVITT